MLRIHFRHSQWFKMALHGCSEPSSDQVKIRITRNQLHIFGICDYFFLRFLAPAALCSCWSRKNKWYTGDITGRKNQQKTKWWAPEEPPPLLGRFFFRRFLFGQNIFWPKRFSTVNKNFQPKTCSPEIFVVWKFRAKCFSAKFVFRSQKMFQPKILLSRICFLTKYFFGRTCVHPKIVQPRIFCPSVCRSGRVIEVDLELKLKSIWA